MQDRYVGDIGDFGKYGLLRALCGTPNDPVDGLRLGVIWCLNSPDANTDGKHIEYLCETRDWHTELKKCDTCLFTELYRIVKTKERNVKAVEDSKIIFPRDPSHKTLFFDDPIPSESTERNKWLQSAFAVTEQANIAFFDPDNGVDLNQTTKSRKHISVAELQPFIESGKSLIIYHHQDRSKGGAYNRINYVSKELQSFLGYPCQVLWWHRKISRFYLIINHPNNTELIEKRLNLLQDSKWFTKPKKLKHKHFTMGEI